MKGEEVLMHQSRYSPAACAKDRDGAGTPCSLWRGPHQRRCLCPEGSCSLWRPYAGACSPDRNCGLGRTHNGAGYPEGLQPVARIHAGAGEKCEEEGEGNCYGLTTAPHSPSTLCCAMGEGGGRGLGNEGVKLSLGKRVGGKVF